MLWVFTWLIFEEKFAMNPKLLLMLAILHQKFIQVYQYSYSLLLPYLR